MFHHDAIRWDFERAVVKQCEAVWGVIVRTKYGKELIGCFIVILKVRHDNFIFRSAKELRSEFLILWLDKYKREWLVYLCSLAECKCEWFVYLCSLAEYKCEWLVFLCSLAGYKREWLVFLCLHTRYRKPSYMGYRYGLLYSIVSHALNPFSTKWYFLFHFKKDF